MIKLKYFNLELFKLQILTRVLRLGFLDSGS